MARDWTSYLRLLKGLLPTGRAWNRSDPVLNEILGGKAVELARVDQRMIDLINERDTRTTNELVTDHEEEWGITPDSNATVAEREVVLTAKVRELGGMRKQYYIALAAEMGYTITIEEFRPSWAGLVVAGDPCGEQWVLFYWRIAILYDPTNPTFATGITTLLERLNERKPAHTTILYYVTATLSSDGFGFNSGFDSGFERFLG